MIAQVGPIKVISAILCDQVRSEINGLFTIVGALGSDPQVADFPVDLAFGAFLDNVSDKTGSFKISFLLRKSGDTEGISVEGDITIDFAGRSAIPVPQLPIHLDEPGDIEFLMRVDDEPWTLLITRSVKKGRR